jgi:hypothetical protein
MTSDVYEHYVECYFEWYVIEYENNFQYIHNLFLNNKKIYYEKETN